jgi:hypothetical protein
VADVPVSCITKQQPFSSHEHITHIGNQAAGWRWTREQVIQSIDAKSNSFYVQDPVSGKRAYIGVVRPNDGREPWLQTYSDGKWNDNLLSLPQCPGSL